MILLRVSSVDGLPGNDSLRSHGGGHLVRVELLSKGVDGLWWLHVCLVEALLLRHGTVLVGEEERFEVDDLLSQLRDLRCQVVVFRAVQLDLLL